MRIIKKTVLAVALLSGFSASVFAATEVRNDAGHEVTGHISVAGASTVDEVVAGLNKKAEQAGAASFKVTAVGGKDKLWGNAELLK
ncbi:YdgH/BhsA/McbA-like domain containing protein [Erwinia sp. V71]|uniref:YdgH/BhsA/McbA-like domain containing protein n=1 Tax=Erwinia sp. V71 TaxID=3369424 RepID=UPI003F62409B